MQLFITLLFKLIHLFFGKIRLALNYLYTYIILYTNNVNFNTFQTNGIPSIIISRGAKCVIGKNFRMNNGLYGNPIGRPQPCLLFVDKGGNLIIGENVGMSATAIVVTQEVIICDNVKIGGGVCIYDTDFHSLDPNARRDKILDNKYKLSSPILIKKNSFIGAHTTLLKGITIGENSIVGACSLVTKNIPDNEIWAGNPAKFIRSIIE